MSAVPRVASSLDDLRVGMVVAFAGQYGNGYVRTVTRIGSNRTVKVGRYDTAYRLTDDSFETGQVFILSDPPPEPVTVSRAAFDRLAEAYDAWASQSHPLWYLTDAICALVDEVRGNQ